MVNGEWLKQTANKQKRMGDEMDINLEVFNLGTDFFGDLHSSSRFTDMLCDAHAQYGDYFELDMCPMWGIIKVRGYRLEVKELLKVTEMEESTFSFEKLKVYQVARALVKDIYVLQNSFPKEERYALGDQVRRAATSITANLAEGSGRQSVKEKIHFIEIAFGSLTEVFCELQTACDLNYIEESQLDALRPQFAEVAKMLSGLRKSFETKQ